MILKLEVDDWKRDALLASLNRLQHEVDTSRTGAQALGAFFIEATGTLGEGFEKLEPARKWLDSIAAVLWGVRQNERSKLPAPTETKQIPPPRKKEKPKRGELDDDIPF